MQNAVSVIDIPVVVPGVKKSYCKYTKNSEHIHVKQMCLTDVYIIELYLLSLT